MPSTRVTAVAVAAAEVYGQVISASLLILLRIGKTHVRQIDRQIEVAQLPTSDVSIVRWSGDRSGAGLTGSPVFGAAETPKDAVLNRSSREAIRSNSTR